MPHDLKRIIVSRTDRIGDVVLSLPVFASLKECFQESQLIALVSGYTSDVVASFPDIDTVITSEADDSVWETARKLRAIRADAILFLFPRFRLATAAFIAGVPIRVGTAYRWYSFLFNRKVREHRKDSIKSEAEYNLSLASAIGCTAKTLSTRLRIDEKGLNRAREFMSRHGLGKFVVLHPGSGGSATDWSTDNFRKLCAEIIANTDFNVVVTGSTQEESLCAEVASGLQRCLNAAGKFSLLEFIAFLSMADVFVSNSTGPIHLAAAVGTPVVGIYPNNKPMTPARWAPISDRKVILTPADGSDDLNGVSVSQVLNSISTLLPVSAR